LGRLPYLKFRQRGLSVVGHPTLTPFLGPAINDGAGSSAHRFMRRLAITRALIALLPPASLHYVKCHREVEDIIAFQMEYFSTAVQFTHEFRGRSTDEIWRGMRRKTRSDIRRAEQNLSCLTSLDAADFISFYIENLQRRQTTSSIDLRLCRQLIDASIVRDRGRLYAAFDNNHELHAAAFCAWDGKTSYYLMSTRRPNRGNLASSLVLWRAICEAVEGGRCFDMAGVSSDGTVEFYAGFGGAISPRFIARRDSKLGAGLRGVFQLMNRTKKFG
jgi:hypothetical protein